MAETDKIRVSYRPTGGLNSEAEALTLENNQVEDSVNWLYERGVAACRPEAVRESEHQFSATGLFRPSTISDEITYGKSFQIDPSLSNSPVVGIFLTDTGEVHKRGPTGPAEITGAETSLDAKDYHNADLVNSLILIGNNKTGLIRWDFDAGNTYTIISAAKYRYVAGHLSRAVAAFNNTAASENGKTVGWSVAGDETDWSGAGSGSTILADIPDFITGVKTVRNVWVIMRSTGITLGYPTGIGTSAFRFETHTKLGPGCPFPSTIDEWDNRIYYVGESDVYYFDLSQPVSIGERIRDELLGYLRFGVKYRGFVEVRSTPYFHGSSRGRHRYHLVPFGTHDFSSIELEAPPAPHFVYDIASGAWSKHTYVEAPFSAAFYMHRALFKAPPATHVVLVPDQADPDVVVWSPDTWSEGSSDAPSVLKGKRVLVNDDPGNDYTLCDVLLVWAAAEDRIDRRSITDIPPVELSVECEQTYNKVGRSSIAQVLQLTPDNQYDWHRTWFNIRLTGQFFRPTLIVPHGIRIKVERIEMFFQPGPKSKAGLTS